MSGKAYYDNCRIYLLNDEGVFGIGLLDLIDEYMNMELIVNMIQEIRVGEIGQESIA